ncbi:MAG: hypothetical protein WDN49_09595 [Acetobacteraceae bacterium]
MKMFAETKIEAGSPRRVEIGVPRQPGILAQAFVDAGEFARGPDSHRHPAQAAMDRCNNDHALGAPIALGIENSSIDWHVDHWSPLVDMLIVGSA